MHKTVVTFVFKKKRKNLKVFLFSSALAFMKTDKGQICYFPSEKAKGALIPTRDHCHLGTLQVQSVSYVFAMSRLLPSHFNE